MITDVGVTVETEQMATFNAPQLIGVGGLVFIVCVVVLACVFSVVGEQESARLPLSEVAGPLIIQREPSAPAETCLLTFPGSDEESDQRVVLLCRGSEPG